MPVIPTSASPSPTRVLSGEQPAHCRNEGFCHGVVLLELDPVTFNVVIIVEIDMLQFPDNFFELRCRERW